ncbi:hypothetical protein PIB30_099888, partial [Stylosanthes scabra]|nr:hypothetical protein [Stylosanthes scabra]
MGRRSKRAEREAVMAECQTARSMRQQRQRCEGREKRRKGGRATTTRGGHHGK